MESNLKIKIIAMPTGPEIGNAWNATILEEIDAQTAMVVCPHVHWMYGIVFDLEAIGKRARSCNSWLIIDGTQSIGAYPFNLQKIQPDALICAGYKWLLGPYSIDLAYFGEVFDNGVPIEETWMGREESNLFHKLTDYNTTYRPKAYRYNMGQHSNFIQLPMLKAAIQQLLPWQPFIQSYCKELLDSILPQLEAAGFTMENTPWKASHLIGIGLPKGVNPTDIQKKLSEKSIFVSARGPGIRVSPHLYNTKEDMQALLSALLP
jgi:selenocysteine lyase/cysteine desulfurase